MVKPGLCPEVIAKAKRLDKYPDQNETQYFPGDYGKEDIRMHSSYLPREMKNSREPGKKQNP
jgi:hypothetical protein